MAGRTDRLNARDLQERLDGIVYEGDVIRAWVAQMVVRLEKCQASADTNPVFPEGYAKELRRALAKMRKAEAALVPFERMVAARE